MRLFENVQVMGFMVAVCIRCAASAQSASTMPSSSQPSESERTTLSDSEAVGMLAACARKYAEAKTYRDEGEAIVEHIPSGTGKGIVTTRPFRTAFEREGRFLWEYRYPTVPGEAANETGTVWSRNQQLFEARTTSRGNRRSVDDMTMAIAPFAGDGLVTAITPLLVPSIRVNFRTTQLDAAVIKGTEEINGHECTKIEGKQGDKLVSLWLDESNAIRKIQSVQTIDPAKIEGAVSKEKFTSRRTITFDPIFDEKIDQERFHPFSP